MTGFRPLPFSGPCQVILGGGRRELMPKTVQDIETKQAGRRGDGKNLISVWKDLKKNAKAKYVTNREGLLGINTTETDYVLGECVPGWVKPNRSESFPSSFSKKNQL